MGRSATIMGMIEPRRDSIRPRVEAIEHVVIDVRVGSDAALSRFYGELLGLTPLAAAPPAVLAFGTHRVHLRLVPTEQPLIDPHRRRCCLEVPSLEACRRRLFGAKVRHTLTHGMSLTQRRLFVSDPTGHLLELRQYWPF